jgi:hypothetical protein
MNTIKAIAHLNELTKDVTNDYYLLHGVTGTLYDDDIIQRLEAKEIATKNVNGKAFVQLFLKECALAVGEGYNVVTGLFRASIGIRGVVYGKDLGRNIPAEQVNTRINLIPGAYAREAVRDLTVSVAEQPAPTGPVIQSITNPVASLPDTLNAGAMVLLQGMRLAVKGDNTDAIGVYFTSTDGSVTVHIPDGQLSPNTAGKLQFVLPAQVTPGEWKVKIATQSTSNTTTFTKETREYEYPGIIAVL